MAVKLTAFPSLASSLVVNARARPVQILILQPVATVLVVPLPQNVEVDVDTSGRPAVGFPSAVPLASVAIPDVLTTTVRQPDVHGVVASGPTTVLAPSELGEPMGQALTEAPAFPIAPAAEALVVDEVPFAVQVTLFPLAIPKVAALTTAVDVEAYDHTVGPA